MTLIGLAAARYDVMSAALEDRVQIRPAGSGDNDAARVLIDGEDVGQAAMLLAGGWYLTSGGGHFQPRTVKVRPEMRDEIAREVRAFRGVA